MSEPDQLVDARGLLCPWPALRLSRAARLMGGKGSVRIIADDPIAPSEIARLCAERGWTLTEEAPGAAPAFLVRFD